MVVKSIPVVEAQPVSGGAPLVRNDEVTPPGYEKIVKALKRGGKVANPWAVAWSMKSKGIKPKTSEAAPVASGVCHDEEAEACQCLDCKKVENGVPSNLLHDETPKVPVKSFRDDIQRKIALRKVMGKHQPPGKDHAPHEATFPNPPGPIPAPFKKNSKDEVVGDYAPGKRYSKTNEAVPSSFNDDPAGMDDTSDLDLGMLDPDNNEEIPTGDDQLWTKEEVNYRYSGDKFESCGNCVHFKFPGACEIIAGPVRPVDVCDKFEAEDEDKGEPFGWENPPEESEQIADTTVPSTLVPLKDTVQAKLVAAPKTGGYGGFGKSYGMVTADDAGGDAFGKRGMKNDDVVKSKRPSFGPASSWGMVTANDEGGPGSGRKKFAPEQPETDEDRQVATFTRRETPKQRSARIASKKVDPETAKAVRKAFASEGGPGSGRHPEGSGVVVNGTQEHPTKGPHTVFTDKVTGSTMMLPAAQATPENMAAKAIAKRREFYGDPTQRRQAMKKTARGINSESAAISALAHRLAESAFDKLKNKLAHKKGIYSPGGLAAKIGRDKYGKAGMAKKAAAGRRKTTEAPGEFMPFGPGKTAGDASGKMAYEPTQRNKKFKGFRDSGKRVAPSESAR